MILSYHFWLVLNHKKIEPRSSITASSSAQEIQNKDENLSYVNVELHRCEDIVVFIQGVLPISANDLLRVNNNVNREYYDSHYVVHNVEKVAIREH